MVPCLISFRPSRHRVPVLRHTPTSRQAWTIGQVLMGQRYSQGSAAVPRYLDMPLGQAVSDSPGARVEENPDPAAAVDRHLDEVISAPQRPELQTPLREDAVGLINTGAPLQVGDPPRSGGTNGRVGATGGQRDRTGNVAVQALQIASGPNLGHRELRPAGDHATPDVHPDGGGQNCPVGGDDRPHRRAQAEMSVGHQSDIRLDEGHLGREAGLRAGGCFEDRGPRQHSGLGRSAAGSGPLQDRLHRNPSRRSQSAARGSARKARTRPTAAADNSSRSR